MMKKIVVFMGILLSPMWINALNFVELQEKLITEFIDDYVDNPAALWENQDILPYAAPEYLERLMQKMKVDHYGYMEVVTLAAQSTPKLAGKNFSEWSLMAYRKNKLIAIPFQFDEFDDNGIVYVKGVNEKQLKHKLNGKPEVFDGDDEMVFMFRDAGLQRHDSNFKNNAQNIDIVQEIVLTREGFPPRYAYIVNKQKPSDLDYVRFDKKTGTIETTVFTMKFNPKNLLKFEKVAAKAGRKFGQDVFDAMGFNISTGIFNQNVRVGLSSHKNLVLKPIAVKKGAIRDLVILKVQIKYLKVPLYKSYMQMNFYEQQFSMGVNIDIKALKWAHYFVGAMKRPEMRFTIDFHNIDGARYTFANMKPVEKSAVCLVDNEMSTMEQSIENYRFPGDWIWLDSKVGWNFFMPSPVIADGVVDAMMSDVSIKLSYSDSAEDKLKYERYKGTSPRLGIEFMGMPAFFVKTLKAIGEIDLDNMQYFGEILGKAIAVGEKGKLEGLNQHFKKVFAQMQKEGKINSLMDIAEMNKQEFQRFNFKGMDTKIMEDMMFYTMAKFERIEDYDLLESLKYAKEYMDKNGIEDDYFRYIGAEFKVYFPDSLDGYDGDLLYAKINQPVAVELP